MHAILWSLFNSPTREKRQVATVRIVEGKLEITPHNEGLKASTTKDVELVFQNFPAPEQFFPAMRVNFQGRYFFAQIVTDVR